MKSELVRQTEPISMPDCIRDMIKVPGHYEVTSVPMHLRGEYFVVEVEADGTVHQMNPAGERDGVLRPDYWPPSSIVLRKVESPK